MTIYKEIDDLPTPPSLSVGDKVEISHDGTSYAATVAQLAPQISAAGVTPSGPAGGDLAGTYPNPTVAPGALSDEYLELAGGTLSGNLIVGTGTDNTALYPGYVSITGGDGLGLSFENVSNPSNQKPAQIRVGNAAVGGALLLETLTDAWDTQQQWTFARDGSTTLPGTLTGTTATFSSTLEVSVGDGSNAFFAHGPTKGVRIVPTATHTLVQALAADMLSLQPMQLQGSTIDVLSPLTGTTATMSGTVTALSGTAVGAAANTQAFVKASSTANLGLYYGAGPPTGMSAAKGSMYSNTTATTTTTRLYVNTDGGTTWTNLTTAA